jgi:TRAP-type C4-dicarboxylate transport system permease small subunit
MDMTTLPGPALIRWLDQALKLVLILAGSIMVVLVFLNVVTHIFNKDIAWTTELCEFLMVWASFLGGAAAARCGAHMTITEFLDKLEDRGRLKADGIIQLLCLIVLALLIWYGLIIVNANWGNQLTVLGWPMAFQYMALPVGSALSFVFVVYDLLQIIKGVSRKERYGE